MSAISSGQQWHQHVDGRNSSDGVDMQQHHITYNHRNENNISPSPIIDGSSPDVSHALFYQDGRLMSAPLDALIQHLTPTSTYYPDRSYCFAFLLGSRLYLTPHQLLARVCQISMAQQDLAVHHTHHHHQQKHHRHRSAVSQQQLKTFGYHMAQLLREWSDKFPYDFRHPLMMRELERVAELVVSLDDGVVSVSAPRPGGSHGGSHGGSQPVSGGLRADVSYMIQNLLQRLSNLDKYEHILRRVNEEAEHKYKHYQHYMSVDMSDMCPDTVTLAEQLTHIELERLNNIGPEEFVHSYMRESHITAPGVSRDSEGSAGGGRTREDCRSITNLDHYIQWFNRLSFLVATEICKHSKKKARVKMMDYFIDVAQECQNIGNFNSLMAIIAGLTMSCVSRLKKSWGKVSAASRDKFDILEHQGDPSSNFSTYRSSLKAALWRCDGARSHHTREKIVVPFFTLLVKDTYVLCQACSKRLSSGHINFDTLWSLAQHVTRVISWKHVECPFERRSKVLNYLLTSPVMPEQALNLQSFQCEPPETGYEKEHLKQLKVEEHEQKIRAGANNTRSSSMGSAGAPPVTVISSSS